MHTYTSARLLWLPTLLLLVFPCLSFGGLNSATVGSDGTATLTLNLASPAGSEPASLQWTLTYPTAVVSSVSSAVGGAGTNAAKTLVCSSTVGADSCVLYGLNANPISNGTVATFRFAIPAGVAAVAVGLSAVAAASPSASSIAVAGTGGTITRGVMLPSLTSLTCSPGTLGSSSISTCTVTISGAARRGARP